MELDGIVRMLIDALRAKFGGDYSFIICGRGRVIAASTIDHGEVPPRELNQGSYEIDNRRT